MLFLLGALGGCASPVVNGRVSMVCIPNPVLLGPVQRLDGSKITPTAQHGFRTGTRLGSYEKEVKSGLKTMTTTTETHQAPAMSAGLAALLAIRASFIPVAPLRQSHDPTEPLRSSDVFVLDGVGLRVHTVQSRGPGESSDERSLSFDIDDLRLLHLPGAPDAVRP